MKKENRTYIMYLDDMNLAMERIAEYVFGMTFSEFKKDYKTVDAVVRNFEVIGEASKSLPNEFKEKHPDIPWGEMYLLRNKVSHEYFGIDYEIIWDVATNYLPDNKKQLENILCSKPRKGWEDSFRKMHQCRDDKPLMDDVFED